MEKRVFVKFVSEPRNDTLKSIVGLACAAQAVADGHRVSVFFAAPRRAPTCPHLDRAVVRVFCWLACIAWRIVHCMMVDAGRGRPDGDADGTASWARRAIPPAGKFRDRHGRIVHPRKIWVKKMVQEMELRRRCVL